MTQSEVTISFREWVFRQRELRHHGFIDDLAMDACDDPHFPWEGSVREMVRYVEGGCWKASAVGLTVIRAYRAWRHGLPEMPADEGDGR